MPKPYFAGVNVNHWKRYVRGNTLDRAGLLAEGLNDAQCDQLEGIALELGWFEQPVATEPERAAPPTEQPAEDDDSDF